MVKSYEIDFDDELVENASKIFETLGTDIDTAINIFLKQAVLRKGFPFEVAIPSENELEIRNEEVGVRKELEEQVVSKEEDTSENEIVVVAENLPEENENTPEPTLPETDDIHGGISEEEESSLAVAVVSPEIAARVAANEELVAQMRDEIGDKAVTPEFDENEDDDTHGDYEQVPAETENSGDEESVSAENESAVEESPASPEPSDSEIATGESEESSVLRGEEDLVAETASPTEGEEPVLVEEGDSEDEDENTPDNLFDAWDVGEEEDIGCR